MRRTGGAAAVVTAVVLALVPAVAASAAPAGDPARPPVPKLTKAQAAAQKAKAKKKARKLGVLQICNHTGYVFGVYADGPSIREDDLAGSFDECTDWKPVKIGDYSIGFTMRTPGQAPAMIEARIERRGVTFYKQFNSQESLDTNVGPEQVTRIDLFVPQS
jgi:hypothetical protein